jgi:drug/metabolite transporter (DMT)-like permease
MTAPEWSMLLTLSVLWGGSFFFVAIAVGELPPFTIVVLRVTIAAVALHLILRILGERLPKRPDVWTAFVAMGFLNNLVPFVLIVWAQTQIASGVASILNATTPLFTVIVAHALTQDEKMTGGRLIGVMVGFTGVAVMIGGAALQALGGEILAQLAVLAAAVSYACAGVFGRRFHAMGVTPLATATGQLTASSVMLMPLTLIVDLPWTTPIPSAHTIGAVVALSLLSTSLAYIPRDRRRDEPPARHLPNPGQRHPARRARIGRGVAVKSSSRHGHDRPRTCDD